MTLVRLPFALLLLSVTVAAQSGASRRPTPTPAPREEQEQIRVITEEVRLPVVAYDEQGRFDPTLEPDDVLVLEDTVPQQVRSVRHIPANVLLLVDTGGWSNPAMKTSTTRDVALRVAGKLKRDDLVAVMQFGETGELLLDWTADKEVVARVIRTKLISQKRARLAEALMAAAELFRERPAGSRHIVLITDGVEAPGGRTDYAAAAREIVGAQATVHVISYTAMGREAIERPSSINKPRRRTAADAAREADPSATGPRVVGSTSGGMTIEFDPAMRRKRKEYIEATKQSERRLTALATETGGRILLPLSPEEMAAQAETIARDIGAQYVVTYTPKRPLAAARRGEYRRVEIAPRRLNLQLRTRPGYVVP